MKNIVNDRKKLSRRIIIVISDYYASWWLNYNERESAEQL